MEFLEVFAMPSAWMALITLAFLEIVLGIDNIVFLSIVSSKLPPSDQPKARRLGLLGAMVFRIALLFSISWLMQLSEPLFHINSESLEIKASISGRSIIIFLGGLFLLYKSVSEIHHKLEGDNEMEAGAKSKAVASFAGVIAQIMLLDIVFSFDSVLTAIGMVSFDTYGYAGAMSIMVTAVIIAVLVMMLFAEPVSKFVNEHPTIQMLGLSFLILIGVMLLVESAHLANLSVLGSAVNEIPKGYIYFAIAFSLLVEFFNMKIRKKK